MTDATPLVRLDSFLAQAIPCTRSEAKGFVRRGRVQVGGKVTKDPGAKVAPAEITFDGQKLWAPPPRWTRMIHKPLGVACSHDPRQAPLLYDLLNSQELAAHLEAVGRLDRETSGLLVLTNDGDLLQRLTHPRRHVWKVYEVSFAGRLHPATEAAFRAGVALPPDPEPTLPAFLTVGTRNPQGGTARIGIREGRYHQIRRMFELQGATVTALHRVSIGALLLPSDLVPGETRDASPSELALMIEPGPPVGPDGHPLVPVPAP